MSQEQPSTPEQRKTRALARKELEQINTFFQERLVGQPEVVKALINVLYKQNALLKRVLEHEPESEHPVGIPADPTVLLLMGGSWGKSLATRLIPMALSRLGHGSMTVLTPLPQDPEGTLNMEPRAVASPFATVIVENIETAQFINARFVTNLAHLLETGVVAVVNRAEQEIRPIPLGLSTFVMTSGVAEEEIRETLNPETRLGFLPQDRAVDASQMYEKIQRVCMRALDQLPPDLLRRVDETVVLRPLSQEDLRKVFDLEIDHYRQAAFPGRSLGLAFEGDAKERLFGEAQEGLGIYGAHALRRVLQRHIDPLVYRAYNDGALTEANLDEHAVRISSDGDAVQVRLASRGSTENTSGSSA